MLGEVNVNRLKEVLSFLGSTYPFQDETAKDEFQLLVDNIDTDDSSDAVISNDAETVAEETIPVIETPAPADDNPAQDNPPPSSTANNPQAQ